MYKAYVVTMEFGSESHIMCVHSSFENAEKYIKKNSKALMMGHVPPNTKTYFRIYDFVVDSPECCFTSMRYDAYDFEDS